MRSSSSRSNASKNVPRAEHVADTRSVDQEGAKESLEDERVVHELVGHALNTIIWHTTVKWTKQTPGHKPPGGVSHRATHASTRVGSDRASSPSVLNAVIFVRLKKATPKALKDDYAEGVCRRHRKKIMLREFTGRNRGVHRY